MQQIRMKSGRIFAMNDDGSGVFELKGGTYIQHRGNNRFFRNKEALRRYVRQMLNGQK